LKKKKKEEEGVEEETVEREGKGVEKAHNL